MARKNATSRKAAPFAAYGSTLNQVKKATAALVKSKLGFDSACEEADAARAKRRKAEGEVESQEMRFSLTFAAYVDRQKLTGRGEASAALLRDCPELFEGTDDQKAKQCKKRWSNIVAVSRVYTQCETEQCDYPETIACCVGLLEAGRFKVKIDEDLKKNATLSPEQDQGAAVIAVREWKSSKKLKKNADKSESDIKDLVKAKCGMKTKTSAAKNADAKKQRADAKEHAAMENADAVERAETLAGKLADALGDGGKINAEQWRSIFMAMTADEMAEAAAVLAETEPSTVVKGKRTLAKCYRAAS